MDELAGLGGKRDVPAETPQAPGATVATPPPGETKADGARTGTMRRLRAAKEEFVKIWFGLTEVLLELWSSASAARAPLAVAIAFWLVMLVPDQTDEAVRVLLDPDAPWIGSLTLWLVSCGLLGAQMLLGGLYVFDLIDGHPMHGRPRNPFDRFLFSLLMATPCLAVGFAMALAREAGDAADIGWWSTLLATFGMVVAAAFSDALRWRDWKPRWWRDWKSWSPWKILLASVGVMVLGIGLLMLAASGARCTFAFVACGTVAGVSWSLWRHPPPIETSSDVISSFVKRWKDRRTEGGVILLIARLWKEKRYRHIITWSFVAAALLSYGVVLFFFKPVAPLELTLWFALLLPLMIASAVTRERWRVPFLALAITAAFVCSYFDRNDIHTVRYQRAPRDTPLEAAVAFVEWLKSRGWDKGDPHPVFLVAAEGGGVRAAYWTALVLEELRARDANFPEHTFLIAGVSGGSLGAAAYTAALKQGIPAAERPKGAPSSKNGVASTAADTKSPLASYAKSVEVLRTDLLSPLLRGLFLELPTRALPERLTTWVATQVGGKLDRSVRLEIAFEKAWKDVTGTGIDELYVQDLRTPAERNVPNLLLLTTSVETGHRMAVGHLAMPNGPKRTQAEAASPCRIPSQNEKPETAARLWNLADEAPGIDLRLSTAAMLSARFTLLTPAGTLPCGSGPRRRFVDGGYFENSGMTTLLDVIAEVRETAAKHGVRLVVIRIENSRATTNTATLKGSTPGQAFNGFGELWSPIRTMMGTRQARGELAVASLRRVIDRSDAECRLAKKAPETADRPAEPCPPIVQTVFDLQPGKVHIPLGWWLTDGARKDMEQQLPERRKALDCVHDLLAGGTGEKCKPE